VDCSLIDQTFQAGDENGFKEIKPSCHMKFVHVFTLLQCIFEELSLLTTTNVRSSKMFAENV